MGLEERGGVGVGGGRPSAVEEAVPGVFSSRVLELVLLFRGRVQNGVRSVRRVDTAPELGKVTGKLGASKSGLAVTLPVGRYSGA